MTEQLAPEVPLTPPTAFTQDELDWKPWIEPKDPAALTEEDYAALVQRSRANNDYFRLLVRDPQILLHRTKTDFDIFYNKAAGLPRADRELAAAAASRFNGCVYCASVHARFASQHAKKTGDDRTADVQRLLDEGVTARLDPRWDAIVDAVVDLTKTPSEFDEATVASLRAQGLDDAEILDAVLSGAFFNWANRLMLSLGEPTY